MLVHGCRGIDDACPHRCGQSLGRRLGHLSGLKSRSGDLNTGLQWGGEGLGRISHFPNTKELCCGGIDPCPNGGRHGRGGLIPLHLVDYFAKHGVGLVTLTDGFKVNASRGHILAGGGGRGERRGNVGRRTGCRKYIGSHILHWGLCLLFGGEGEDRLGRNGWHAGSGRGNLDDTTLLLGWGVRSKCRRWRWRINFHGILLVGRCTRLILNLNLALGQRREVGQLDGSHGSLI